MARVEEVLVMGSRPETWSRPLDTRERHRRYHDRLMAKVSVLARAVVEPV